jgi:DNA mismatch repair protein MutL
MGIHKLQDVTVRTIGASQVLTDSATVVKELIDNALDAHATSIAVEIHNNTLDVIQVRDNGHGVAPEDRPMVAKPNCTSKLVNIDDLRTVAATSLGFRGQALASVAELSGSLVISTRVEGEPVATALKINQRGDVVGQERASLPVGTTVRITDFIKANPVRRQVALKNTEKCLRRIKQTLQAYVFVRPHVRFSLRVLKAKNNRDNWIYAPKPNGGVEDAALKIVGSACVTQCTWTVIEERGFTLQAFLPRPDAEPAKISGIGSFMSIDARPVSIARGTLKQVIKVFRDSWKAANPAFDGIKEPFICMKITCPSASYDPNVEPAKDDVVFEEPDILLALVRKMFETVYPACSAKRDKEVSQDVEILSLDAPAEASRSTADDDGFMTSLKQPREAFRQPHPTDFEPAVPFHHLNTPVPTSDKADPAADEHPSRPQHSFRFNMYGCDEEDLELIDAHPATGLDDVDFEELRQARKDVTISNPWVMAKMNSSVRKPMTSTRDDAEVVNERDAEPDLLDRSPRRFPGGGLATPRPSSPSPPTEQLESSEQPPSMRVSGDGRMIGATALPSPHLHMPPPPSPSRNHHGEDDESIERARQPPRYDYGLSSQMPVPPSGTPLDAIPDLTSRTKRSPQKGARGNANKPFVSPVVDQAPREKVWFDHFESMTKPRRKAQQLQQRSSADGLVRQGELGDLLDEKRALTPPPRNRDIRDFVGSVNRGGDESVATVIERRNYGRSRSHSVGSTLRRPSTHNDENVGPSKGVLSARGFIPASELTALETRFDNIEKRIGPPPKRRKTGQGILREVSTNTRVQDWRAANEKAMDAPTEDGSAGLCLSKHQAEDGEEEYAPPHGRRAKSRRRRTTEGSTGKVHRTKSSRLTLERVPAGQGIHNVMLEISTSMVEVSHWAGKVDEDQSLLGWNEAAVDACSSFASPPGEEEVQVIAAKLQELLVSRVSDGEMVQELGVLVRDAFAAHARDEVEAELYADAMSMA